MLWLRRRHVPPGRRRSRGRPRGRRLAVSRYTVELTDSLTV